MNLLSLLRGPTRSPLGPMGLPGMGNSSRGLGGIMLGPDGMPLIPPFLLQSVAHPLGATFSPTPAPDTPDAGVTEPPLQPAAQPVAEGNETPEGAGGPVPASDPAVQAASLGDPETAILRAVAGRLPLQDSEGSSVADFTGLPEDLGGSLTNLLSKHPATAHVFVKPKVGPTDQGPDIPPPSDIRNPVA